MSSRSTLLDACTEVHGALRAGPSADLIAAVRDRLAEPTVRIAVGGRVKAGKSTLINALLGQSVAATAATECTKLVAWFHGSVQNRIGVRGHDGSLTWVPGKPGGGVPADVDGLGVPVGDIAELHVEVANDRLSVDYTIVDTPGMDALSGLDELALTALARCDALLYVMPHPGQGDVEALESLRRTASASLTAANVIGVLSRVDELGEGAGDPWTDARRIATGYGTRLRGLLGATVPIVGLLAETATGDRYVEDDTRLLRRLAVVDGLALDDALYSVDDFRQWDDGPLDAAERERLLGLLGRYGIRVAVDAVRAGTTGTSGLLTVLRRSSGIDDLVAAIGTYVLERADRLRTSSALAALASADLSSSVAAERAALEVFRDRLADVRAHPAMRQAELAPALADLAAGRLRLAEADAAALLALATGHGAAGCLGLADGVPAAETQRAADAQIVRWRQLENAPSRLVQRHARSARELCEELFFRVR